MNHTGLNDDEHEEIRLLRDSAEALARQYAGATRLRRRRDEAVEFDAGTLSALAEAGFLGMAIPESYGGLSLSLDHWAAAATAFGGALLTEPVLSSSILAARLIAGGDNEALQQRLLPLIAQGRCVAAVACAEDTASIGNEMGSTRVVPDREGQTITGVKRLVRPGAGFDGVVVVARMDESQGLYWVSRDAPGLVIKEQRLSDGGHVADLRFDAVRIAACDVVQSPGVGAAQLLSARIDEVVIVTAAELLGILRRTLAMTLDYLRVRQQFGKPIGSFQALQHRAVNLYIQQELAEVALANALEVFRGDTDPLARHRAASRAKSRCADAALLIAKEAIQMHGAIGFTDEHDVGLYLKRAIVQSSWLGNAAQHRRRYAALAGAPS